MLKWKDETSYSQGETDRTPRVYAARVGMLRAVVHRLHGIPDQWFFSCEPFTKNRTLKSKKPDTAQQEAETLLVNWLSDATEDLGYYLQRYGDDDE